MTHYWISGYKIICEGNETAEFWNVIGGEKSYSSSKALQVSKFICFSIYHYILPLYIITTTIITTTYSFNVVPDNNYNYIFI